MSLYGFQSNTRTGESNKVFFPQQATALHKFFIDRTYDPNQITAYHLPDERVVNDLHKIELGDMVFSLKAHNQTIDPYTSIGTAMNTAGNAYARATVNGVPYDAEWTLHGAASLPKSTLSENADQAMCDVVVSGMTQICNTGRKPIQVGDRLIARMPTQAEVASRNWGGRDHIDRRGKLTLVVEPWDEFKFKNLKYRELTSPDISIPDLEIRNLIKTAQIDVLAASLNDAGVADKGTVYDEITERLRQVRRIAKRRRVFGTAQGSAKPGLDLQVVIH